jgi:hypothetical protein
MREDRLSLIFADLTFGIMKNRGAEKATLVSLSSRLTHSTISMLYYHQ